MGIRKKTFPLVYGGAKQKFARSVVAGDLVFLSGSSGRTMETGEVSSDDVREQTRVALDKVRLALEEAGTSMDNIVKVLTYFKDMKHYEPVKQTEFEYWQEYAPALAEEPVYTVDISHWQGEITPDEVGFDFSGSSGYWSYKSS